MSLYLDLIPPVGKWYISVFPWRSLPYTMDPHLYEGGCVWEAPIIGAWHDDVIKWKHFPRYRPFVRGIHRSPVNSPHKGQWRGALMSSLICVWIDGWVNNREAGDLRRYRAHYDVIVMCTVAFDILRVDDFGRNNDVMTFKTLSVLLVFWSSVNSPYFRPVIWTLV